MRFWKWPALRGVTIGQSGGADQGGTATVKWAQNKICRTICCHVYTLSFKDNHKKDNESKFVSDPKTVSFKMVIGLLERPKIHIVYN